MSWHTVVIAWIVLFVISFFVVYQAFGDTCCERHPEGAKCYPC